MKLNELSFGNNEIFTSNAEIKLSDNFISMRNFKINSNGDIFIERVEGSISKSLMEINFDVILDSNNFSGDFNATFSSKFNMNGQVNIGSASCEDCEGGYYPFGYYQLTLGTSIPVFPGVSISRLGGRFGYNYFYDFNNNPPNGYPQKNNYIIGVSFGLQDNAGLIDVAVILL